MTKVFYSPIRIIIADDHEIFREGFQSMIKKQTDIKLIGEAEDGQELVDLAGKLQPDVIITDIKMPVMDGIQATRLLADKYPHIRVIALSMFDDEDLIVDMLEAGAKGYLMKNAHKSEIITAVKTVYNRQTYYCDNTTHKLAQLIAKSKFNPYKKYPKAEFTVKEIEIIELICDGLANKEIADRLNLSVRTVEGYKEKVHEKMNVKNTAGVVVYAIRHGIYQV